MSFFDSVFDATGTTPDQGYEKHPVGKFPARISETKIDPQEKGNAFVVTFTTAEGSIRKQYGLGYDNPADEKVKDIAQKQVTALCHATGVFRINWPVSQGAEFLNKSLQIEVVAGKDDKYHNVSMVYDAAGNLPGKGPGPTPQQVSIPAHAPVPPQQPQMNPQPPQGGWAPPDLGQQQAPQGAPQQQWAAPQPQYQQPPLQNHVPAYPVNGQAPYVDPNQAPQGWQQPPQQPPVQQPMPAPVAPQQQPQYQQAPQNGAPQPPTPTPSWAQR